MTDEVASDSSFTDSTTQHGSTCGSRLLCNKDAPNRIMHNFDRHAFQDILK